MCSLAYFNWDFELSVLGAVSDVIAHREPEWLEVPHSICRRPTTVAARFRDGLSFPAESWHTVATISEHLYNGSAAAALLGRLQVSLETEDER
jgi:hypothetical protein